MTLEMIQSLYEWSQSAPTLLYFGLALGMVCTTLAVSGVEDVMVRSGFYLLLAAGAFFIASNFPDVPNDFTLNLSTELVGALIVGLLLGDAFKDMPLVLLGVALLGIGSTMLLDGTDSLQQASLTNLSTEILGAFIVAALLTRRHWMWSHAAKDFRVTQEAERLYAEQQYQAEVTRYRRQLADSFQQQFDTWLASHDNWDVAVMISATDKHHLRLKQALVRRGLQDAEVLMHKVDDEGLMCCVAGTLKLPAQTPRQRKARR